MPARKTRTAPKTHQTMKNVSFELLVASWVMHDGWQVFNPVLDHGHKTDILISDGPNYHRIQIKTVNAKGDEHTVPIQWKDSDVDIVVYFARNSTWGSTPTTSRSAWAGMPPPTPSGDSSSSAGTPTWVGS